MHLMPKDLEKLMLHYAGDVAIKRKSRGIKLNYTEAIALITHEILEGAREGKSVKQLVEESGTLLKSADCMVGVKEMLTNVQVEATFPDGTKLVSVNNPIQ